MCTTRLSSVITGWGAKETTCSRRSTFARTRSMNGTTVFSPASQRAAVGAQPLHHVRSCLRHDPHGADQDDQDDAGDGDHDD